MAWNISAAIKHLVSHASSKALHQCAKYVRMAIEAGGLSTAGRPVSACNYKEFLPKIGFNFIGKIHGKDNQSSWTKRSARPGDIAVMDHGVHGHICMYSGQRWISDFVQNNMWVYGGDGTCYLYRYNGEIDGSLSGYMDFMSTGLHYLVPLEQQKDHICLENIGKLKYNILAEILESSGAMGLAFNNSIHYSNELTRDDSSVSESLVETGMFWSDIGMLGNFTFSGAEGDIKEVCKACYQAFIKIGCTPQAARGILANIAEESAFNPRIVTWDGSVKSGVFGVGGGLCGFYFKGALPELAHFVGWNDDKLAQYNNIIKNSGLPKPTVPCHPDNTKHITNKFGGFPFSFEQQLNYLCDIINKKYSAVKKITDESSAAMYWIKNYERPAHIIDRWIKNGRKVLSLLNS